MWECHRNTKKIPIRTIFQLHIYFTFGIGFAYLGIGKHVTKWCATQYASSEIAASFHYVDKSISGY